MARYAAYVGSYTYYGKSKGITIYDVDVEKGTFTPKKEVAESNCSYVLSASVLICARTEDSFSSRDSSLSSGAAVQSVALFPRSSFMLLSEM